MAAESLSSLIARSGKTDVSDDQGAWRQFVLDHLDYLAAKSQTYSIAATVANLFRYDLRRFLKEQMKRHEDIGWIVQEINGIRNDFEFDRAMDLIIPTDASVIQLFHSYRTVKANTVS